MTYFRQNLSLYWSAIGATFYIVFAALTASVIVGLLLGTLLYATRAGGLLANRFVHIVLNLAVNFMRPLPFIIFIVAIRPLQLAALHSTLGNTPVMFGIAILATFAVMRIVEQSLLAVEPGVVEAARAAGAGPLRILATVVIPEGLGSLILGFAFIFVGIIDMSAQASVIAGNGLGPFAIVYG